MNHPAPERHGCQPAGEWDCSHGARCGVSPRTSSRKGYGRPPERPKSFGRAGKHTGLHAVSVDVEEWYHICRAEAWLRERDRHRLESRVERGVDAMLDFLRRRDIRATFFILGEVAERHPNLVATIEREGHEIASHGYGHRRVDDLTPEEFEADIRRALEIVPTDIYRAPEWSIHRGTPWALPILHRAGFSIDSSMLPRSDRDPVGPTTIGSIREFPVSTIPLLHGRIPFLTSAALRILPRSVILGGMRRLEADGIPANLAIHSWELDAGIPRVPVPLRGIFRYINTRGIRRRLEWLFDRWSFQPIGRTLDHDVTLPSEDLTRLIHEHYERLRQSVAPDSAIQGRNALS